MNVVIVDQQIHCIGRVGAGLVVSGLTRVSVVYGVGG